MRKEIYKAILLQLSTLYNVDGEIVCIPSGDTPPDGAERVIKHIDLWNRNTDFLERDEPWPTPAVFVEFASIKWESVVTGVHYTATPEIRLHIVTKWKGGVSDSDSVEDDAFEVFNLPSVLRSVLAGMRGSDFWAFDIKESITNHDHEDVVESIEVYTCEVQQTVK